MVDEYHIIIASQTKVWVPQFPTNAPPKSRHQFGTRETIAGIVTAGVHVGGANVICVEYNIDPCGIAGSTSVLVMGTLC